MLMTRAGMMAIIWNRWLVHWRLDQDAGSGTVSDRIGNALFVGLMREFCRRSAFDRIVIKCRRHERNTTVRTARKTGSDYNKCRGRLGRMMHGER